MHNKNYPKYILIDDPLHSLTAWSRWGNSFIAFRISGILEAQSFQTALILETYEGIA